MAKSLEKARKQIAKKKGGTIDALHRYSRDSKRLHKAQVRDERLKKLAASRRKQGQPLIDRISFFQTAVRENQNLAMNLGTIQGHINRYVQQHASDLAALQKSRRPGRSASTKEDLLKMKLQALETDQQNGFFLPDLSKQENIEALASWDGAWSSLAAMSYVRVSKTGTVKPASFPPNSQ